MKRKKIEKLVFVLPKDFPWLDVAQSPRRRRRRTGRRQMQKGRHSTLYKAGMAAILFPSLNVSPFFVCCTLNFTKNFLLLCEKKPLFLSGYSLIRPSLFLLRSVLHFNPSLIILLTHFRFWSAHTSGNSAPIVKSNFFGGQKHTHERTGSCLSGARFRTDSCGRNLSCTGQRAACVCVCVCVWERETCLHARALARSLARLLADPLAWVDSALWLSKQEKVFA